MAVPRGHVPGGHSPHPPGAHTGREERYDILEPLLESARRFAGAGLGRGRRAPPVPHALLERSVSQCLELGPSGIFLSGGLDSVSIAAVALDLAERRGLATPLALSLAFPTPETTEEDVQVGVAKALGLPQIMLGLEESVAPEGLVRRALELSADWPLPRTYLWSGPYLELAHSGVEHGVRAIMTGAGGDEWLTVDLLLAADFIEALQFRQPLPVHTVEARVVRCPGRVGPAICVVGIRAAGGSALPCTGATRKARACTLASAATPSACTSRVALDRARPSA